MFSHRVTCIYMIARQVPERQCVCSTLRKATRSVTQFYDNALRPSGLRSTQFNILAEIHGAGSTSITRLTKILIMDQTTLTRSLALLERNGLLRFVPAEDGRVKSAELTKKGTMALVRAQPLWAAAQEKMLSSIGPIWASLSAELERLAHQEKSSV